MTANYIDQVGNLLTFAALTMLAAVAILRLNRRVTVGACTLAVYGAGMSALSSEITDAPLGLALGAGAIYAAVAALQHRRSDQTSGT